MDEDHEMEDPVQRRNEQRWEQLGFRPQKEIYCNKYLPYADLLDEESPKFLEALRANLGRAIALRDMNPGIGIYSTRLLMYIKLYGLKFSKEDHVEFIKLFLELLTIPYLEPAKINKIASVLIQLLSKSRLLSPDDLQIEWRPLYELSNIYLNKSSNKGDLYRFFPYLEANLQHLMSLCAVYFPKSATQEILDEFLPRLQPLDIGKHCTVFEMLSVLGAMPHGHELWVHDFMTLWNTYQNPQWAPDMMALISSAAAQTIGKVDWEPYIPVMFTRILRSMDLPVSYKSLKSARNPMMYNNSCTSEYLF